jgi:hypothetical protein
VTTHAVHLTISKQSKERSINRRQILVLKNVYTNNYSSIVFYYVYVCVLSITNEGMRQMTEPASLATSTSIVNRTTALSSVWSLLAPLPLEMKSPGGARRFHVRLPTFNSIQRIVIKIIIVRGRREDHNTIVIRRKKLEG